MTPRVRALLLLVAVVSAAGCAAPREETWIGSNVGVTVDSSAAKTATPETR